MDTCNKKFTKEPSFDIRCDVILYLFTPPPFSCYWKYAIQQQQQQQKDLLTQIIYKTMRHEYTEYKISKIE